MKLSQIHFLLTFICCLLVSNALISQDVEADYYTKNQNHFAISEGLYRTIDDFMQGESINENHYIIKRGKKGSLKVELVNDTYVYNAILLVYDGLVYAGTPLTERQYFMPFKGSSSERYQYLVTSPTRLSAQGEMIIQYNYIILDRYEKSMQALSPANVGQFFKSYPTLYDRWQNARYRDIPFFESLMEEMNAANAKQ